MPEALVGGHVKVFLMGEKLRGAWALTQTKFRGGPSNWLLVKVNDDHADARRNPVRTQPESVLTGRTVKDLRQD
jgi:hypothetical protein